MMRLFNILLLIYCVFASNAYAASAWHTSGIKAVYPQADGSVVIIFENNAPTCLSASSSKYHHLKVGQNSVTVEGFKNIYAAALAAAAGGQTVTARFSESSTNCYINRIRVNY